jgi:hypothetical protein
MELPELVAVRCDDGILLQEELPCSIPKDQASPSQERVGLRPGGSGIRTLPQRSRASEYNTEQKEYYRRYHTPANDAYT